MLHPLPLDRGDLIISLLHPDDLSDDEEQAPQRLPHSQRGLPTTVHFSYPHLVSPTRPHVANFLNEGHQR